MAQPRHRRPAARLAGHSRARLFVVVLAPLVVVVPLIAQAAPVVSPKSIASHASPSSHSAHSSKATKVASKAAPKVAAKRLMWSRTWGPPLALLSHYRACCASKAGFLALPTTYDVRGSQEAVATARFKTNWVDVKALVDGPNIAQQGRYADAAQFKLQIFHSKNRLDHRGQCRVKGTTGEVLAFGPRIDVADGHWHTITCVKSADTAAGTTVTVYVDGVAGKPAHSGRPVGNIAPAGKVDLGGRTALASSDSLDGWISSLAFWVVG
jgi:Concanavalin A-like lectin/glucanases superfamily